MEQESDGKAKRIKMNIYQIPYHLIKLLQISHKASLHYDSSFLRTIQRCFYLKLKKGFMPYHAFQLGLLDPIFPDSSLPKYCSINAFKKIQESLNPTAWTPLTKNKSIFYRYCTASDITIPKLYAIFNKGNAGWSYNNLVLKRSDEWKRFFEDEVPSEFVIKPSCGYYGRGIKIFSRSKTGFIDAFGNSFNAKDIYEIMLSDPCFDSFVIQERLINHSDFIRLSNTKTLQTIRIMTFVDSYAKPHILHSHLKITTGKNIVDNLEHGATGNLQATVSHNGFLKPSVTVDPHSPGIRTLHHHPKTGIRFNTFQIPMWDDACILAKEIALKFLPIRVIGWDVAITPKEVFVVEGNFTSEPPNIHRVMDSIQALLLSDK